jgi:hypothetical protein
MAETDLVREFDFDDVDIIDDSGNSVCARENDIAVGSLEFRASRSLIEQVVFAATRYAEMVASLDGLEAYRDYEADEQFHVPGFPCFSFSTEPLFVGLEQVGINGSRVAFDGTETTVVIWDDGNAIDFRTKSEDGFYEIVFGSPRAALEEYLAPRAGLRLVK